MSGSVAERVVAEARAAGATLAGLASAAAVARAPSYAHTEPVAWPADARAVLVLGLSHPVDEPELDWWGGRGGTPGNRVLTRVGEELKRRLRRELELGSRVLPYHVERGGIFLKDAATLAGLGVVGANNLLVTPELGPRVRWRALLLDLDPPPPREVGWEPCAGCDRPCLSACPQQAFPGGRYDLERCALQMQKDEASPRTAAAGARLDLPPRFIAYCRACELACPVGRGAATSP